MEITARLGTTYRIGSWWVAATTAPMAHGADHPDVGLTHCGLVMPWIEVSNGSGNGLVPSGTKPSPEPMLNSHLWGSMTFTIHNFAVSAQATILCDKFENYTFKLVASLPSGQWVNSSPPSAAYMRQWIRSALVQIMACRLCGAKPLSEPMLEYCQSHP